MIIDQVWKLTAKELFILAEAAKRQNYNLILAGVTKDIANILSLYCPLEISNSRVSA